MIKNTESFDKDRIESFLRLNRDAFSVKQLDDGVFRVHLSAEKTMFNTEIARFLYDHGNNIFRSVKMANYSDVNERLERVVTARDPEKAIEYLIKDTATIIDNAAKATIENSNKPVFPVTPSQRAKSEKGFLSKMLSDLHKQVDSVIAIDR